MSGAPATKPRLLKRRKLVRKRASVEPEAIRCTGCGAPLEVQHAAMAEILSCVHCGAVLDLRDPEKKVLRQILVGTGRPESTLKIGSEGGLGGENWTVLGRIRLVDGEGYHWDEYLLLSERSGYAWLEEDEGNWSLERRSKNKPAFDPKQSREGDRFRFLGETYQIEERGQGTIRYIEGEFPYHAQAGDRILTSDAKALNSSSRISASWTESELEWLSGKGVSPSFVYRAFGLPEPPGEDEDESGLLSSLGFNACGCLIFTSFIAFVGFLLFASTKFPGGSGSGGGSYSSSSESSDSFSSSYRSDSSSSGSSYGSGSSSSGSSYGSGSGGGWGK